MRARTWLRAEWDRIAGFGLILLGGLLLLIGYLGVRGTPFTAEALSYIASGGLGGLFCLGLGVGLLLSADLHDEWRKLDRIEAALRGAPLPDPNDVLKAAGTVSRGESTDPEQDRASGQSAGSGHDRGMALAVADQAISTPINGDRSPTLALAPDRRTSGFQQAALAGSLALLLPLSVMGMSWRSISRTEHLSLAADGMGTAILGLSIGLTVIGLALLWMRLRVARRARNFLVRFAEGPARQGRCSLSSSESQGNVEPDLGMGSDLMVVPGLRRFHRSNCPALSSLAATAVARSELDPDLVPCGICGAR